MNYQMLKTLLDSLVSNFKCPSCNGQINENNLEIVGAAGTSVNLDIVCPSCEKHTFVKAEVSQINLGNIVDFKPENMEKFKKQLHQKLTSININKSKTEDINGVDVKINEKEILELRKALKIEHINVEDFLGDK